MLFYIRKSLSVGPFRFNLSKSGIGMSTGVRGFRIDTGPRGNYIQMGRAGLYYRASLSSRATRVRRSGLPATSPSASPQAPPNLAEIETGHLVEMTDSNARELLQQINHKLRSRSFYPLVIVVGLLAVVLTMSALALILAVVATFFCYRFDKTRRSVVLMYDLDADAQAAFEALTHSFDQMTAAQGKWIV